MLSDSAVIVLLAAAAVAFYFAPTAVAILRRHPRIGLIALLNLLVGWTIVGWIALLVHVKPPLRRRAASGVGPTAAEEAPELPPAPLPPEERDEYADWLQRNRNRW